MAYPYPNPETKQGARTMEKGCADYEVGVRGIVAAFARTFDGEIFGGANQIGADQVRQP
jgi:hypothetical protein